MGTRKNTYLQLKFIAKGILFVTLAAKERSIVMLNSLEVIEHLEEKIHQLPPNLIMEVDNFVNELLRKYQQYKSPTVFEHVKPVSLGLKVSNVDNIAEILEQNKSSSAKRFLKELRPHCFIGDVISPIEEQWDVTL